MLNPKLIQDLIESGLDEIHISIYGLSDEQYKNFCGVKISYERFKENIALLYQLGHSNGRNLNVYVKIAGEYFSEEEQQSFIDQFSPISDTIFIEHVTNIWPELKFDGANSKGQYDLGIRDNICPTPFYMLNIHSDGLVSPCCVEYQKKLIIGDVKTQSLLDIWNGEALHKLRIATLKRNLDSYPICQNCEFPTASLSINLTDHIQKLLEIYE